MRGQTTSLLASEREKEEVSAARGGIAGPVEELSLREDTSDPSAHGVGL